jgi:hypothetical protein
MLRELITSLALAESDPIALIRYMREAFGLTLQQSSPIAGWAADGSGELQDDSLDRLLLPAISKNRSSWDSVNEESPTVH